MGIRLTPSALLRNLNWRTKALLVLLGSIVVFMSVVAATQRWIVLPNVERAEVDVIRRQINQIATRQAQRQSWLKLQASELARSDRVRRLLDPASETPDLTRSLAEHSRALQLDLVVVWNAAGESVFFTSPERRATNALPPRIEQTFIAQGLTTPLDDQDSGIMPTPRGLLLYARQKVASLDPKTASGTLLIGEFMPLTLLQNWLSASDLDVRFYRPDETMPALANPVHVDAGQEVAALSDNEIVGRLYFGTIRGDKTGTLEIRAKRPMRATQIHSARLELAVIGLSVLGIAAALWWIIEVAFVRRLEQLTTLVSRLDQAEAVKSLQVFTGEDEVGRLARTTGEMASHLSEARDLAITADHAKTAFLRMITHELRTPMNGVIGFSTLLRDTPLTSDQIEYVKVIEASGNSLLKLIDDLIDYTTIEASGVVLNPRPIRLREWLNSIMLLLAAEAERKGLQFQQEVAVDVPALIWVDAARLQQVLSHLLGNALKFTPAGSVRLKVETLTFGRPAEKIVRFFVIDTGIGITPEIASRLFQPLSPGDGSSARRFGGIGMGLVICRRLVHAMGGNLSFESLPGRGTEFCFTLPTSTEAPSSTTESPASETKDPLPRR